MSADYKPGTVALVTFQADDMLNPITQRGIRWQRGWSVVYDDGAWELIHDRAVSDVRPLVTLDFEAAFDKGESAESKTASELARILRLLANADSAGETYRARVARRIADQIEAQIKPPKPAEPQGLGAVVEDTEGVLWVRSSLDGEDNLGKPWKNGPVCKHWQIVDAVRVLSEGVQP